MAPCRPNTEYCHIANASTLVAAYRTKSQSPIKLRIIFLGVSVFLKVSAFTQKAEIDSFCRVSDSLCAVDIGVVLHSVLHKEDYDSLLYFDRYYIDTLKGVLVKAIYDFNFYGAGEYLEFYYRKGQVVKAIAKHKLNERNISGTFYFKNGNVIAQEGGEISPGKTVFDIQQILKTGNEYVKWTLHHL